jgi:hypothetical protein
MVGYCQNCQIRAASGQRKQSSLLRAFRIALVQLVSIRRQVGPLDASELAVDSLDRRNESGMQFRTGRMRESVR